MPITQERMIAVCTEGAALRQAFTHLRDEISTALRTHRSDPLMAVTIIEGIVALSAPPDTPNLIAESVHWRYRQRDNEKNRDRMRRRRGSVGASPPNAPTTLIRPLSATDFSDIDLESEYAKWNKG